MLYERGTWSSQIHKGRNYNSGWQQLGGGYTEELVSNRHRISAGEDEKVLEMDHGDGCATMWHVLSAAEPYT